MSMADGEMSMAGGENPSMGDGENPSMGDGEMSMAGGEHHKVTILLCMVVTSIVACMQTNYILFISDIKCETLLPSPDDWKVR